MSSDIFCSFSQSPNNGPTQPFLFPYLLLRFQDYFLVNDCGAGSVSLVEVFLLAFYAYRFLPLRIDQLLEFLRYLVQIAKGRIDMACVGHIVQIEA